MIKVGNKYISADKYNLILGDLVTIKSGKGEGVTNFIAETFHKDLPSLFKKILDNKLFSIPQDKKIIQINEWIDLIHKELETFDKEVLNHITIASDIIGNKIDFDNDKSVEEDEEVVTSQPKSKTAKK